MALFETHYFSLTLKSYIALNIVVPTPTSMDTLDAYTTNPKYDYAAGLPVLYLLHGAYGDYSSWVRFSNIDRYAQDKGIIVVMPSAENSFYQDLRYSKKYKTFLTEELPRFVQSVLPASRSREKTYIAGLSMGGYGAWYLALSRPDLFSHAASMSGAVDIVPMIENAIANPDPDSLFPLMDVLKEGEPVAGGPNDLIALYDAVAEKSRNASASGEEKCLIPRLYQACGTEDFLYQGNCRIREELMERGADLTYEEGPGIHDWNFWDEYIKHILNWLP